MLCDTWIRFSKLRARHLRALLVASSIVLLSACGEEAAPDGSGGGGQQGVSDPLDLASCDEQVGELSSPVALPALGWEGGADEHAAHCAFRALDPILEGKRILCSGENDHGVSQSNRWHAALARYLIHTANVRVIALETETASAVALNRYVATGDSADLERGLAGIRHTLTDTKELVWFLESLRAVQAELPEGEQIQFTGFDIAVQPALAIEALANFLEQVDPDSVVAWKSGWLTNDYAAAAAHSELFLAELETQREAWIASSDEAAWKAARTYAANLFDGFRFLVEYMAGNYPLGNSRYREPGMIRNVEAFAAGLAQDERLLLIGHNLHCAKAWPASGAQSIAQSPALGTHLARSETWGSQYLVLAQLYLRGTHNVLQGNGIVDGAFDSGEESLAGLLGAMSEEPALLIGSDAGWPRMNVSQDLRSFGTSRVPLIPNEQFDAFLWVREVEQTDLR